MLRESKILSCCGSMEVNSKDVHFMFRLLWVQIPPGLYAGIVMMSFDHVLIPTRGNWFQTNPLEHESDDGNTVSFVCVTNGKDMALQRQI